jgi:hypothetical protein
MNDPLTYSAILDLTLIVVVTNETVLVVMGGGIEWVELAELVKRVPHMISHHCKVM